MFRIRYSCLSHIGRLRAMNQDNYICEHRFLDPADPVECCRLSGELRSRDLPLFGIFDGMGGEEAGEQAAFLAAKAAAAYTPGPHPVAELLALCRQANADICAYMDSHDIRAMGSTAAMLLFRKKSVVLCNIGDSKVFSFLNGELRQLSVDHVCESPQGGKAPLSQSLGVPTDEFLIEPYAEEFPCRAGEQFLICSDGLTDMVSLEDICHTLQTVPPDEAAGRLLDLALEAGGRDNISILLLSLSKAGFFSFLGRKPN